MVAPALPLSGGNLRNPGVPTSERSRKLSVRCNRGTEHSRVPPLPHIGKYFLRISNCPSDNKLIIYFDKFKQTLVSLFSSPDKCHNVQLVRQPRCVSESPKDLSVCHLTFGTQKPSSPLILLKQNPLGMRPTSTSFLLFLFHFVFKTSLEILSSQGRDPRV